MTLAPGSSLGPYQIEALAGAGAMGEVYRARDTWLDRTVALKILPARVALTPGMLQRFEREARAIAAVEHLNICPLYDVGAQDGVNVFCKTEPEVFNRRPIALTITPTTTTATAPTTFCQRNAIFVNVATQATEPIPAMRPRKAPVPVACRKPTARMKTPRIEP
jgi:serine/threonine protein kinase